MNRKKIVIIVLAAIVWIFVRTWQFKQTGHFS